jgi:hypothetical protein
LTRSTVRVFVPPAAAKCEPSATVGAVMFSTKFQLQFGWAGVQSAVGELRPISVPFKYTMTRLSESVVRLRRACVASAGMPLNVAVKRYVPVATTYSFASDCGPTQCEEPIGLLQPGFRVSRFAVRSDAVQPGVNVVAKFGFWVELNPTHVKAVVPVANGIVTFVGSDGGVGSTGTTVADAPPAAERDRGDLGAVVSEHADIISARPANDASAVTVWEVQRLRIASE